MFGLLKNLFKRTRVEDWEKEILINIFDRLGDEYAHFKNQVIDNLLSKVSLNSSVRPNWVGFSYNTGIVDKYEQKSGGVFTLKGFEIFDVRTSSYIDFEIYISHGLITGYSTPKTKEFIIDVSKIKIDNPRQEFWGNSEYQEIETLLWQSERALINSSEVYKIVFNDTIYYHIQDLEDGDFVGIDNQKNVYIITHDPFAIKLTNESLSSLLMSSSERL